MQQQDPVTAAQVVAPRIAADAETWTTSFFVLSMKRAFRLHILNEEVLPQERSVLESQAAHVTDPEQQSFLAWRRSVLFMVALMFVPLSIMRVIDSWTELPVDGVSRAMLMLPAFAEVAFCILAFVQLKNWAQWQKSRRVLFWAWAFLFLSPFIVYLYPFRTQLDGTARALKPVVDAVAGYKVSAPSKDIHRIVGMLFGIRATLTLAPKIISLLPGLIRASIVSKLLFPGTSAPGWLMVMGAPVYALFAFVIVLFPYQVTGSIYFLIGNAGVMAAQVYIGVAGRRLTKPLTVLESSQAIHRSWMIYICILVGSVLVMAYGVSDLLLALHYTKLGVVTGVLGVASNVLLETLIGTDAIVTAMAALRRRGAPDPRDEQLLATANSKLDMFTR